jgi:CheY-like chemotaxis protein
MPIMNGITFVEKFRNFLTIHNQTRNVDIQEPLIVFLTAYNSGVFKTHLKSIKIEHVYDKPLT